MSRGWLIWGFLAMAQAAMAGQASQPKLEVRLETHLTSYSSRPGSPFHCVVLCPFEVNGEILIPQGSLVYGRVRRARPVHLGLVRERAALELTFSEYTTPDGQTFPLHARLASIDNAREEVLPNGRIKGVLAAENPEELWSGIWGKPTLHMLYRPLEGATGLGAEILEKNPMGPVGPAVLFGIRCLILRFPEPEIHLPPGTDMELVVDESSSGFARRPAAPVPAPPADLDEWLREKPVAITKAHGQETADLINVAFAGSRQELLDAFSASGWYPAEPSNFKSLSRLYLAFNDKSTYSRAPVSKLLYGGKPPDLVFEKSFDTVAKRHHVRIWEAGSFEGKEIWLGAATHDIGIAFNGKHFSFSHRVDPRLDHERAKISVDLTFAGCSEPVSYAWNGRSAEGSGPAMTDGRIAIVFLQPCTAGAADDDAPAPGLPGTKGSRLVRRLILETRSYILRENVYYWAFQVIRHHGSSETLF